MADTYQCKIIKKNEKYKYVDFLLECSDLARNCEVGQFLHISCGGNTTLRRPISVCDAGEKTVRVVFEVKGQGTWLLSRKNEGDTLDVLGPLGNGFEITDEKTLLVGGGLGSFPLLYAAKRLGKNASALLGFRTKDAVYLQEDFESLCQTTLVTDDGTQGDKGFVTDFMKPFFGEYKKVFCCGPDIMMKNVSTLCEKNGIECHVSLEERMGCGTGVCLCCTRPAKTDGGVENLCVCKQGPVFDAKRIYGDFNG